MKTLLPFLLSHAFVFGGASALRGGAFSADLFLACSFASCLLAFAWFDVGRVRRPLRASGAVLRPDSLDRSSARATVHARRAA